MYITSRPSGLHQHDKHGINTNKFIRHLAVENHDAEPIRSLMRMTNDTIDSDTLPKLKQDIHKVVE